MAQAPTPSPAPIRIAAGAGTPTKSTRKNPTMPASSALLGQGVSNLAEEGHAWLHSICAA